MSGPESNVTFLVEGTPVTQYAGEHSKQAEWGSAVCRLRQLFGAHFGVQDVERRCQISEDYAAFMEWNGGAQIVGPPDRTVYHASQVASGTAHDFRPFVADADDDEPPLDGGFWLTIGRFSDKHFYLLCCDREHSHYGAVVDGHDSHPWLNGVDFGGVM